MYFDTQENPARLNYQLLTQAVVPRPIAWVSTLGPDGIANLAPYSFFTVASCQPPVLCVVQVNPRDRLEKDTLSNLQHSQECVVNVVSHGLAQAMNTSCADYPPEVDEFEQAGLEKASSTRVSAPGVMLAQVRFECSLREIKPVGNGPMAGTMMLLDVLGVHVNDSAWADGAIDAATLDAIGKLGGDDYSSTRDRWPLTRPKI